MTLEQLRQNGEQLDDVIAETKYDSCRPFSASSFFKIAIIFLFFT